MDRSLLCTMLLMFTLTNSRAQEIEPTWGGSFGSSGSDLGYDLTLDATGHVYIVGAFEGTTDMDPGPDVFELTSAGGSDIFVSKFDTTGTLLWAKAMGGIYNDGSAATIAVDPEGNVYTTGGFMGTADFDPGPATFNMTAATTGQTDIFITKLDANGELVWAKGIVGGTWWDNSYDIAIDPSGSVVVVGRFYYQGGPRDFDPGPGTYFLSAGHEDIFVLKLTTAGDFVWAVAFGTAPDESRGYSLAVDDEGSILTTGYFRGTVDFDPDTVDTYNMTSVGTWNVFYHKMDADAHFLWARALPVTTTTYYNDGSYGSKITVGSGGDLFATGRFSGTIDFDPGAGNWPMTAIGNNDAYVLKFTPNGDLVWARSLGGNGLDEGMCLTAANGDLFLTGTFDSTADLDPGPAVFSLTPEGDADMFLLQLDTSGVLINATSMGGGGYDRAHAMKVSPSGARYVTGWFAATTDLDPGSGVWSAVSAGSNDAYVVKLADSDDTGFGAGLNGALSSFSIHPNPANDRVNIVCNADLFGKRGVIEVFDATGRVVLAEQVPSLMAVQPVDLSALRSEGLYLVQVKVAGEAPKSARLIMKR